MTHQPFFYDVTLRDGNQALKKPWNQSEKETIFSQLVDLGVQGIEIGFPASSEMDFDSCQKLAKMAPKHVVVSVLARATENDIVKAAEAVRYAHKPRIHTFIAMNPLGLEHVLKKDIQDVTQIAVKAIKRAKELLPNGQVEFSVEHFGDCRENLSDVINAIEQVVEAGADVVNLPNTVERFRPLEFVQMVQKVYERIGDKAKISVHCHNDLGMATATTVESFFHGATQLETTLNGLGERAGNTDMYQVAVALYNSGVNVPLNMHLFDKTAQMVSEMSHVPIWEKTPIIGSDVLAHRSGIHQDGSNKTKGLKKGQYIAFDPALVGRDDGEYLGFTSQSGKSALKEIYERAGYPITLKETEILMPFAKKMAEQKGELSVEDCDKLYRTHLCNVEGPYQYASFDRIQQGRYVLSYFENGQKKETIGYGYGPVEACIQGLCSLGVAISILEYQQYMLKREDKEASEAVATIKLAQGDKQVVCHAIDRSTTQVSIRAIFNGLNQLQR
ncbi:MAG: 2-isopropylmalate synthase [Alphaproteobacteria bacterium]|nr:2-isopropylmalate synthase [Alphaproteobacteria bacterium]